MKNRRDQQQGEDSADNCPLFVDVPLSKCRAIQVSGVIFDERDNEHKAFYLADIPPTADVALIQREFGGGEFSLVATGENSRQLGERRVSIAGPVLWAEELQEDRPDPREEQFGRRFSRDRDERDRDPRYDPRFDPRLGGYGGHPGMGPPGFGGYGGFPRPGAQADSVNLTAKLLDAVLASRGSSPETMQANLESLKSENDRLRSANAALQNENFDLRRRFNEQITEESDRWSRKYRDALSEEQKAKDDLYKERIRSAALERKIMEMELTAKFSKDGSKGGFDPKMLEPLFPMLGLVVSKMLGLSQDDMQRIAAEQQMMAQGAQEIPGIPTE